MQNSKKDYLRLFLFVLSLFLFIYIFTMKNRFKLVKEEGAYGTAPKWLEVNPAELTAKVVALPQRDDIDYPVEEHLIVEFYSK